MESHIESNLLSKRALASIQMISDVKSHDCADLLQLVTVLGWQVVTQIDEVKKGDKIIYCEIDSLIPVQADWIPKPLKERIIRDGVKDNFRLKTINLRRKISQGLVIPISESLPKNCDWSSLPIGTDVTSILGITKYERPTFVDRTGRLTSSRPFPDNYLNRTDQPRIQSYPQLLEEIRGKPYRITEKLDGTSSTYLINPRTNEFLVCSRNFVVDEQLEGNFPYWEMANKYGIENILRQRPHIALQGELCGPKIQKNLLRLKEDELFIFRIVDIRNNSEANEDDKSYIMSHKQLRHVSIIEKGTSFNYNTIESLLLKAKGKYKGTSNPREGIVVSAEDYSVTFKVINNDYLIKHD